MSTNGLSTRKGRKGWWIRDAIAGEFYGPYDTRAEARSDQAGVTRCYEELEQENRKG